MFHDSAKIQILRWMVATGAATATATANIVAPEAAFGVFFTGVGFCLSCYDKEPSKKSADVNKTSVGFKL